MKNFRPITTFDPLNLNKNFAENPMGDTLEDEMPKDLNNDSRISDGDEYHEDSD